MIRTHFFRYLQLWKEELKNKNFEKIFTKNLHNEKYILGKNIKEDEKLRMQLLNERIVSEF